MALNAKNRKRITSAVAAAFSSALFFVLPAALGLEGATAQADPISDEAQFVEKINDSRVENGLQPLAVNPALVSAARAWATKMRDTSVTANAGECLISHNPNIRTAVDAPWRKLGENVGCGGSSVDALHTAFMKSPKHRENILNNTFDTIGIGIVTAGDTIFVTEQFMETDTRPSANAPQAPDALALRTPSTNSRFIGPSVAEVGLGGNRTQYSAAKTSRKAKVVPAKSKQRKRLKTKKAAPPPTQKRQNEGPLSFTRML